MMYIFLSVCGISYIKAGSSTIKKLNHGAYPVFLFTLFMHGTAGAPISCMFTSTNMPQVKQLCHFNFQVLSLE